MLKIIIRYYPSEEHYLHCNNNPMKCYYCQMGKLADGLLSGKYSKEAMIKENEQVLSIMLENIK